jgi:hypothetical protein
LPSVRRGTDAPPVGALARRGQMHVALDVVGNKLGNNGPAETA